jgi:hypothetical protein
VTDDVTVIDAAPGYALGEFEHCLLVVWRLQPTAEAFQQRNRRLLDLAGRHPRACAYFEIIEPSSRPPPGELRPLGVEVFSQLGDRLSCIAITVEGSALWSALVRAILTGMTFLTPQFQPYKVFKRLSDAAPWVEPRIGAGSGFFDRLSPAYETVRRAIPPHG